MKNGLLFLSFCFFVFSLSAQDLYFPPLTGNQWDNISPAELGWCEDKIPELYDFLENSNTKAFMLLKDGQIVLEKYFGTFTQDSLWYWASAGKSLTATAIGIAQAEGLLSIDDPTSDYLGTGWTSLSPEQEKAITIRHQLTMTTGLDDSNGNFDCTDPDCLQYLAPPGTRWSYHNAPYTLLSKVLENASGQSLNIFINSRINAKTGMFGFYIPSGYNEVFYSKARSFARFGLMILNKGFWNTTPVLNDADYLDQMTHSSQDLNLAYGYLWWLNGSENYRLPSTQFVFPGQAVAAAPQDMIAALGKNGQILNIVPSQNLIMIRMGANPGGDFFVGNLYNSDIWEKLTPVICTATATKELSQFEGYKVFPNPAVDHVRLELPESVTEWEWRLYDQLGILRMQGQNEKQLDVVPLESGFYWLQILSQEGNRVFPIQKITLD